jgi:hypothetical protein
MPPMSMPEATEPEPPPPADLSPAARDVLTVAWPSFLMAGVMTALVFAFLDPSALHGFGGEPLGWSNPAAYTVAFFLFWGVTALACGITRLLSIEQDCPRRRSAPGHG